MPEPPSWRLKPMQATPEMTDQSPVTTPPATAAPKRARPKLMTLTDAAADRLKSIMAGKPGVVGLRLGIKKGGCAGMEYTMSWAEAQDRLDEVVEDRGVKLLIEPTAIMYLLGAEMDYRTDKLASQFVFNNPNQKSACGCGESVNLVPVSKSAVDALKD